MIPQPSRREFLASSVGLAAGLCTTTFAKADVPHGIVDTHTHFYDPTRPEGVPWPGKGDKALYRRVLPDDYKAIAKPLGVTGTVVVEASPRVEDNQWVLDLAEKDKFVLGLVGNLTPGQADFAKHLTRFAKNPLFRGIRVNAGPLKTGLESPEYLADIKRLSDADLELDVNGGPELLPLVDQLATKRPELRIVINHLANVRIDGPKLDEAWLAGLKATSQHKHVYMKVSALVEGASRDGKEAPRDPSFYIPVLDAVWKAFGDDRVIYGSNWPVSERAADLATVQKIVMEYARGRGAAALEKFSIRNARAAYRWPDRS
ncbi:MAG: amidohydrolase family protein [Planctomycetota bacterium]